MSAKKRLKLLHMMATAKCIYELSLMDARCPTLQHESTSKDFRRTRLNLILTESAFISSIYSLSDHN